MDYDLPFAKCEPMTPEEEYLKMGILIRMLFNTKKDKGGKLYILHLERVAAGLSEFGLQAMTIGLGHDLIEDCGKKITYVDLKTMGFSERVIEGIRCMTKVPGESYEEYKAKVMSNLDSIRCKKKDIKDNSDLTRLKGVEPKDLERMNNYATFYHELVNAEKSWMTN